MLYDTIQHTSYIKVNPITGLLMVYDFTREKWLSSERKSIYFGINHRNIKGTRWLKTVGNIATNNTGYRIQRKNNTGYRIQRNGTITCINIQSKNNTSYGFYIQANNTNLITVSLNNVSWKNIDNLNIDINENDVIQCLLTTKNNENIDYPLLSIEISWRY